MFDAELFGSILPKLTHFFIMFLLPELLTNKMKLTGTPYDPYASVDSDSDSDSDDNIYCFYREVPYGTMVACDAPDCPYEWFHFSCIGLSEEPPDEWFCSECSKNEM